MELNQVVFTLIYDYFLIISGPKINLQYNLYTTSSIPLALRQSD